MSRLVDQVAQVRQQLLLALPLRALGPVHRALRRPPWSRFRGCPNCPILRPIAVERGLYKKLSACPTCRAALSVGTTGVFGDYCPIVTNLDLLYSPLTCKPAPGMGHRPGGGGLRAREAPL